jgi:hypothetical protein
MSREEELRRVEAGRREVERRLSEIRHAVGDDLGFAPRRALGWVVPLVAFSVGLVVARRMFPRSARRELSG